MKQIINKGIGGHQSANSRTDEWLTPPEIIQALGEFDLDPCAPINRPWSTAKKHYTIHDNGLLLPWEGRVWLNPPYGKEMEIWLHKMAQYRQGIALTFARTDTNAFHQYVFPVADSIFFVQQRITFYDTNGIRAKANGGAPNVFIAYGEENVEALDNAGFKGKHLLLNTVPFIVVGVTHTWKSIISVALTRSDGEAAVSKVYEIVASIAPDMVTKNKHYKEKIRQQLQYHFKRVKKGHYTL